MFLLVKNGISYPAFVQDTLFNGSIAIVKLENEVTFIHSLSGKNDACHIHPDDMACFQHEVANKGLCSFLENPNWLRVKN